MPGQVTQATERETTSGTTPGTTPGTPPAPSHHIELVESDEHSEKGDEPSPGLRDSRGWDGKLRVGRNALLQNPEAISDPEYSDEENVLQGDEISADEGMLSSLPSSLPSPTGISRPISLGKLGSPSSPTHL